jgi:hypothetical protein
MLDSILQSVITPKTSRYINSGRSDIPSRDFRHAGQASSHPSSSIPTVHPAQRFFRYGIITENVR